MNGETTWKTLAAVVLGGLASYMRIMAVPVAVLLGVMVTDYISGMLKARYFNEWSSKVGLRGILKKVGYMLTVCVAGVVDWLIFSGLTKIGVKFELSFSFGVIVTIWLIINELMSILENLAALEVPMPRFLKSFVKHLKSVVETKAAESEENNDAKGN